MSDNETLVKKIEEILAAEFDISIDEMTDETHIEDINVTSLEFVEMLFKIEQEFGVSIDVMELPELETVGEIKAFLLQRLASSESEPEQA